MSVLGFVPCALGVSSEFYIGGKTQVLFYFLFVACPAPFVEEIDIPTVPLLYHEDTWALLVGGLCSQGTYSSVPQSPWEMRHLAGKSRPHPWSCPAFMLLTIMDVALDQKMTWMDS